jgi:hypothetical protein
MTNRDTVSDFLESATVLAPGQLLTHTLSEAAAASLPTNRKMAKKAAATRGGQKLYVYIKL